MSNQFTPAPWKYDDSQRHYSTRVIRMNGVVICNPVHQSTMRQPEYDANVRLIAAAPALYSALKELFEQCAMVHKHWGDGANQKEADAAIKAGEAALALVEVA